MMNKTDEIYYVQDEGWVAAGIPYVVDDVRMIILLPDEGTYVEFEAGLDNDLLEKALTGMWETDVSLSIPKFEINSKEQLSETLKDMGMPTAFKTGYDAFPEIFEPFDFGAGNTRIDRVIHQAYIKVDEAGTEAAAATVVEFVTESAGAGPIIFRADKPFIYLIVDTSTNTILFMGRVLDPSA